MNKQAEKQQLRKTMRALEARLSERYLEQSDRRIAAQLLAMPEYQAAETVFCFVSVGREINTRPVLNASVDRVDFAVLPCLTCNHLGQRLGRGGGYYDRFLASYRGGTVLLCREKLIREEIPVTPLDYPIPWVLTEAGLFEDGTPARLS